MSPAQASSSYQPTCLGSIYRCIFLPFGIYPDGTIHRPRQRRLPYFPGKNPSGVACCTPSHVVKIAAPLQVLRSFLIFHFPKNCCMRSKTRLRLFCGSIQFIFEVGDLKKLFYLRTDDSAKEVVAVSPSQSILQCSTSCSNKVIPSRPFVEGSTAETVIQVAEPRL